MMGFNWDLIQNYLPMFIDGAIMTVTCTVVCVVLGTFWGLILGIYLVAQCRHGIFKYVLCLLVRWPTKIYVSAIRGTPLLVQIMVIYYVFMSFLLHPNNGILLSNYFISSQLAQHLFIKYSAFISCILAITLNASANISEIFRASIESIDKGQMEAARSLGMGYVSTMIKVILPQAFRRMLPPLGNNAIAILKDSSLGSVIGLMDLAYTARIVGEINSVYVEPYFVILLFYWTMTFLLSLLVKYMEKRLRKSDSH
ncbi:MULTISPECIES: amino acid ABC transporter permease [unclassified Gilliamella]|uniref:amino acid ABC transporter permease n=1 Tax=unclassified Gilliamella TaxID=2685620 RepID=UPI00130C1FB0|nr:MULTISPECIES: amino acid ABC transporter permease [unclassified Gilliamella]MWP49820.1 ABC transporter permease subunit [Gilliamella sp. Lep-s35]MWP69535.1 ABC transporter permease subunit [Gilliamella sp. Lep-s5]MWP77799.1 ABC transporter permease subunit [Gilliamella sp. Lep-s21]